MLRTKDDVVRWKQATIYDVLTKLLGTEVNEKTENIVEQRALVVNKLEALATGNTRDTTYIASPLFDQVTKELMDGSVKQDIE